MNKLILTLAFASVLLLTACEPPTKPATKKPGAPGAPGGTITIVKTHKVTGFDPKGEPEVREMSDGTLVVAFEMMPPSDDEDEKKYDDFDKQMEKAIGIRVVQDDREFYSIRKPAKDTVEKVKKFLEGYHKSQGKPAATQAAATQPAEYIGDPISRGLL